MPICLIAGKTVLAAGFLRPDSDIGGDAQFTNLGGNLIGVDATPNGDFSRAGDTTFASTGTTIDDVINPTLANNGGPTLTHALVPFGPTVDGGVDEVAEGLDTEHRGGPRLYGPNVDIGAVELGGAVTYRGIQTAMNMV